MCKKTHKGKAKNNKSTYSWIISESWKNKRMGLHITTIQSRTTRTATTQSIAAEPDPCGPGGRSFFSKTCSLGSAAEGLGEALCLFAVGGGGDTARFLLCVFISASMPLCLVRGRLCAVKLNLQAHLEGIGWAQRAACTSSRVDPLGSNLREREFTSGGSQIDVVKAV